MSRLLPRLLLAVVAAAALTASVAEAAPPRELDRDVAAIMKTWDAPGMSIAIVESGQTTLARGYGVRRMGASDKVTGDTLFPTASTGKAMTAAALAVLVEQGKLRWDDKVIDHMPWFQMYDPWVTREMTVRDLLVHRSGLGLGQGDLLFVPRSNLSRRESVKRLRYMKPATSFRSSYAYDNVLYMAVGQLIEEVSGQTWEHFVRDHLFRPLGMKSSTTEDEVRFATPDRAQPHARLNGPMRSMGDQEVLDERDLLGRNSAPAGGIAVSANDMTRWLKLQLAHGKLPDGSGRLFSEAIAKEMWTPVTPMPIAKRPAEIRAAEPQFQAYALGWEVRDYRGHKIVWHSGADNGFRAVVVLIPEKDVGFSLLSNSEEPIPMLSLMYKLLDHYLDEPKIDWPKALTTVRNMQVKAALDSLQQQEASRAKIGPSLPLARYAGDYADPWYGPITIREEGGRLVLDFKQTPGMVGELQHWQYDTFRTVWRDKTIEPALVTFNLDAQGKVSQISMAAASPLADFSYDYQDLTFTPVAAPSP